MKYKVLDTRYINDIMCAVEGDIVYDFIGHDYGCARDDSMYTGKVHISVTRNEDGSGPFFTIPTTSIFGVTDEAS